MVVAPVAVRLPLPLPLPLLFWGWGGAGVEKIGKGRRAMGCHVAEAGASVRMEGSLRRLGISCGRCGQ